MTLRVHRSKFLSRMLLASSLGRLHQHISSGEFVIISAFLEDLSKKENMDRQWQLMEDIRTMGYGYIPTVGVWAGIQERSIFIYNMKFEEARTLAQKYNQESFIYGSKGLWAVYNATTGEIMEMGQEFHPLNIDEEAMAYSQYKNKKFVLSWVDLSELIDKEK